MVTDADKRSRRGAAVSWVAVTIALSGLLTYGYLAVITRSLSEEEYSWFGAYWSLTIVVGFGAFFPVELELARVVHLRGTVRPLPAGTLVALAAILGATLVALLAGAPLLLPALGREPGLYAALLVLAVVSAVQFLLRGLLLGRGAYGTHGTAMLVDSVLRVASAAVLAAAVSHRTAATFGWTLPIATALVTVPLLVRLLLRSPVVALPPAAPDPRRAETVRAVGHLIVGCLASQALLNAIPVVVAGVADPSQQLLAGQFVASFTLVRLPLFVAVPLQSSLVPMLTDLHARGDRRAQRRVIVRLLAGTVGLAAVGAVVSFFAGPTVIGLLFGDRYALSGTAIGILAVGACLYLGVMISGQALVAGGRHRASTAAWSCGLLVAVLVFAVVPGLVPRATLAFTLGSAAALAAAALFLLYSRPTADAPVPDGPALEGTFPAGPA